MKKILLFIGWIALFLFAGSQVADAARIKDLASIKGIRTNQLVGYGLVVGLNGTGDKSGTEFTIQSLVNMLERMGINVDRNDVKVKNVAAVMVTAKMLPFAGIGNKIDVLVSSIGDAKSLVGGTLLHPFARCGRKSLCTGSGVRIRRRLRRGGGGRRHDQKSPAGCQNRRRRDN